jgi:hypothetical protein
MIEAGDHTDEPGVRSAESGTGSAMIRSRLSEADVQEIVKRFRHGAPKHKLATEYGMSLSTIKRLLKAIKVRKKGYRVPLIGQLSDLDFVTHVDHLLEARASVTVRVRLDRPCACGCEVTVVAPRKFVNQEHYSRYRLLTSDSSVVLGRLRRCILASGNA